MSVSSSSPRFRSGWKTNARKMGRMTQNRRIEIPVYHYINTNSKQRYSQKIYAAGVFFMNVTCSLTHDLATRNELLPSCIRPAVPVGLKFAYGGTNLLFARSSNPQRGEKRFSKNCSRQRVLGSFKRNFDFNWRQTHHLSS